VRELPMFPLGSVLLPHMVLPLHVFEPRYQALVQDILDGDREFGVVLIARGHEVGGGDERTELGTIARVVQAQELGDGRWLVVAVGTQRFDVTEWLEDAPYPRATVAPRRDEHDDADVVRAWAELEPRLRRVLALQSEVGDDGVPATIELSDDPELACWQAAVVAPLGPADAQSVLSVDGCLERMTLLQELLDGLEETFRFRLASS
jgi:Lon protease-like protein